MQHNTQYNKGGTFSTPLPTGLSTLKIPPDHGRGGWCSAALSSTRFTLCGQCTGWIDPQETGQARGVRVRTLSKCPGPWNLKNPFLWVPKVLHHTQQTPAMTSRLIWSVTSPWLGSVLCSEASLGVRCSMPTVTSRDVVAVFASLSGIGHTFGPFIFFLFFLILLLFCFFFPSGLYVGSHDEKQQCSRHIQVKMMILSSFSVVQFCVMNWLWSQNYGCPLSTLSPQVLSLCILGGSSLFCNGNSCDYWKFLDNYTFGGLQS